MSRLDCICNRNTKIIATYVRSKLGSYQPLFDGLPYPSSEYTSSRDFFLNEDEWTTFENFERIFRRAKALVNEPNFYFDCGASSTRLNAWGRFHYFVRLFATPGDGFKRIPFFNKNSNDTKEIEVILPPTYDHNLRKMRTMLKVQFHNDFNPNRDYIGDPYLKGILSSIPTIWGLPPASVEQTMNSYNPETLYNEEPDFISYELGVKIEGNVMTLRDPVNGKRCIVGEKVLLEPELVNGQKVFLGKYSAIPPDYSPSSWGKRDAILITQSVQIDNQILLNAGEIFMAPYFILDIAYTRSSFQNRLSQIFKFQKSHPDPGEELYDIISQLRRSMRAKNNAYLSLEKTNVELRNAKAKLDDYARELEKEVEGRTKELRIAQQDLLQLNQDLEAKVNSQIIELEKHNQLRRYLSPKLAEKILNSGGSFGAEPKRKMMTVVFTDIRGFSSLADSLEPEELFHLLDRYLTEMIKIVYYHDGTLNKILGDGLLIFFGDPIPMVDHADRAVRMAVDMQNKISQLKNEWSQYGHELGVGIGINTAFMSIGNFGSDTHRDYTVIGNQVNVAARLEAIAKADQILISQRTYSKLKHPIKVEKMGEIRVKGIHHPVKTYGVIW